MTPRQRRARLKQIRQRQEEISADQLEARKARSFTAVLKAHAMLVSLDTEAAEMEAGEPQQLSREEKERLWTEALPDVPDALLEAALDEYARRHAATIFLARDGDKVERKAGSWGAP
tara:strand:- start:4868 stop:5218 length:351 start_codon:yes stop_codon:yes gene_type:complete